MQTKILVVDDEKEICDILKFNLENEGYIVDIISNPVTALESDLTSYSLIILDIMMPEMSGFDFATRIRKRKETKFIPIIFCSVLNGEDDRVKGLDLGGDDYITKPFLIRELMARVNSVLRRSRITRLRSKNRKAGTPQPDIIFKGLRLDQNTKQCYVDGENAQLTMKEYNMILFFLNNMNNIYTRAELLKRIWNNAADVTNRTIDTNITRLRKKLGVYGDYIVTRLGYGYGFQENAK